VSGHLDVVLSAAFAIVVIMVATWIVSLVLRNASIVDIVWGAGFVVVAWVAQTIGDGNPDRLALLTAMVSIWGVRLTVYLWWRNHGQEEDFRYRSMRERQGSSFPIRSLVTVFGLQGLIMMVVSLPVQLAATPEEPDLGWLAVIGVVVWGLGMFFETVGDAQLARFKADPANAGTVMDRGLWRYTRHPNYFGDFCVWWGIFLVAAEVSDARFGIVGPLLMSFLLMRVSGVPMLERSLTKRRAGYADYIARTSSFFPRPPRTVGADDG
jgi:steroid 5-alpha reductase family enzyme